LSLNRKLQRLAIKAKSLALEAKRVVVVLRQLTRMTKRFAVGIQEHTPVPRQIGLKEYTFPIAWQLFKSVLVVFPAPTIFGTLSLLRLMMRPVDESAGRHFQLRD
jgi:hypothetical protein